VITNLHITVVREDTGDVKAFGAALEFVLWMLHEMDSKRSYFLDVSDGEGFHRKRFGPVVGPDFTGAEQAAYELAVALLDNEDGLSEEAYVALMEYLPERVKDEVSRITDATDGRFYIPEDDPEEMDSAYARLLEAGVAWNPLKGH
jgi:hypothetical protein